MQDLDHSTLTRFFDKNMLNGELQINDREILRLTGVRINTDQVKRLRKNLGIVSKHDRTRNGQIQITMKILETRIEAVEKKLGLFAEERAPY